MAAELSITQAEQSRAYQQRHPNAPLGEVNRWAAAELKRQQGERREARMDQLIEGLVDELGLLRPVTEEDLLVCIRLVQKVKGVTDPPQPEGVLTSHTRVTNKKFGKE